MKYFYLLTFLFSVGLSGLFGGGVRSTDGSIGFDIDNDGNHEMTLNSNGLGIGTTSINSSFQLNGSFAQSFEMVTSDTTLSNNSIILVDSSASDVHIELPYAGNVSGRIYNIKKTSKQNLVVLSSGDNLIDDVTPFFISSEQTAYPTLDVMSNGFQWYILRSNGLGSEIAADNLVLDYDMDQSSANVLIDGSGEGQTGAISGMSESDRVAEGIEGRALQFDGTDDILVPTSPDPGYFHDEFSEKTVSVWVTVAPGGAGPRVAYEEGGTTHGIGIAYRNGPDTLVYVARISSVSVELASTTTFIEDNDVWVHVAAVYDNGSMKLYINGVEEAAGSNDTKVYAHAGEPGIGQMVDNSAFNGSETPWDGRIDNFKMFNRALSSVEIEALYSRLSP